MPPNSGVSDGDYVKAHQKALLEKWGQKLQERIFMGFINAV